ncbi:esterase/lipase superfamily enzyme [Amorphus orientalis]|uniref:Esterase/lipase superfamily enzyme n=1 Tax=Amorphus orientalis TaxID=649198 RepID=A0AAE3VQ28_9HYPH|nr:esterase/lipase superfamily enzyme [Amorphus orientalis]
MSLLLGGCGGRPEGVLIPFDGPVTGTSIVDMVVATTRVPDEDQPGILYTGERGEMSFAEISVSVPPESARKTGEIQWPSKLPPNPETDFVTVGADRIDEKQAFARVNAMARSVEGRHVLVFIHGYNNRFESAVYRLAQIVHDSGAPVAPVLFTWPSRGNLVSYTYDRESANYSRDALERLLTELAKDSSVGSISILSHSMGNWVTLEALRQMAIRNGRIAPKIHDVMLAAPDVDADVFRTQIAVFGKSKPTFTIFVSRRDKALAASKRVWGGMPRIGAIDPTEEPYQEELQRAGFYVVDLTDESSSDRLGHNTFAASPQAVQLIGRQLATGQDLNTYDIGLGDRVGDLATATGANIGAAAGLVVTAPIAIVDPDTWESYDDRVEAWGESVQSTLESTVPTDGKAREKPDGVENLSD